MPHEVRNIHEFGGSKVGALHEHGVVKGCGAPECDPAKVRALHELGAVEFRRLTECHLGEINVVQERDIREVSPPLEPGAA